MILPATALALPASALPENSNDGYVAAAYIVFLALVLLYVAIMAVRLGRVERDVRKLREDAERQDTHPEGASRERETV
jgi:hypothetical protein